MDLSKPDLFCGSISNFACDNVSLILHKMSDLYGEGSSREHVVGAKIQHLDLGDVDALEGDELERLQQELNEDAHMASQEDYYAILNLDHDVRISSIEWLAVAQSWMLQASEEDIKAAYKRLCLVFHPDRHSVPEDKARAESKFQLIQKAYDGADVFLLTG